MRPQIQPQGAASANNRAREFRCLARRYTAQVQTFALQSGSNGNSIYVECGQVRLLFDAGLSARRTAHRLAEHHRDVRHVQALILSHAHTDHTAGAAGLQKQHGLPIYCTPKTEHALLGQIDRHRREIRRFTPGQALEFDGVRVQTIPTPHDAPESVCFVVEFAGRRLGLFTDLGFPFAELIRQMPTLDAVYLESNYDAAMLAAGAYPPLLKDRIRGGAGHLSNAQAAELLTRCDRERLRWAALAHLSAQNNHPEVALATHRSVLGHAFPLVMTSRQAATEMLTV